MVLLIFLTLKAGEQPQMPTSNLSWRNSSRLFIWSTRLKVSGKKVFAVFRLGDFPLLTLYGTIQMYFLLPVYFQVLYGGALLPLMIIIMMILTVSCILRS